MRLFVPQRIKFHGPDPPEKIPEPEPVAAPVNTSQARKSGVLTPPVAPKETPKTPNQLNVEKMFLKFMKQLRKDVDKMTLSLIEYRNLQNEPDAIKKVALWPKLESEEEKKLKELLLA